MSELETGKERRITLRLLAYWEKKRGNRTMPAERDISPHDMGDLWDDCFLLRTDRLDHYVYLGKAISHPDALRLAPSCAKVAASGKPLVEEGEFHDPKHGLIKYRQCLVPLGENGEITAVFGGIRFKIFPA